MWVIAGLGNPGERYSRTRHNVGCMVLDRLAEELGLSFRKHASYMAAEGRISGRAVVFVKPLTFMNRSGLAVSEAMGRFGIEPSRLLVVHDDLDIETGRLKIRAGGGSGGHKGLESIILAIGSKDFVRLKIGIGRDPETPAEEYVLSRFKRDELRALEASLKEAARAVGAIVGQGVERAMNAFNRKPGQEEGGQAP